MRPKVTRLALVILGTLGLGTLLSAVAAGQVAQRRPASASHRQLVIVVDGLRPDYVTPEVMPNLYALGQRGVVFANHHSVFPTVTRVNASSISTGTYPERHGLMGNTVFFPQVDANRFLDTSDKANLVKINTATNGNLLTSQTLGETLQAAGKKLLVVSAGSTGSSFLVNHKVSGGAILHVDYSLPDSLSADVLAAVGPPTEKAPSDALDRRAVDLFLKVGLPKVDPAVTVMWLTRSGYDRARARHRRSGRSSACGAWTPRSNACRTVSRRRGCWTSTTSGSPRTTASPRTRAESRSRICSGRLRGRCPMAPLAS